MAAKEKEMTRADRNNLLLYVIHTLHMFFHHGPSPFATIAIAAADAATAVRTDAVTRCRRCILLLL